MLNPDNYGEVPDKLVTWLDDLYGDNAYPDKPGRQFEEFLVMLFQTAGYELAYLTEYKGDGGIDLYVKKGKCKYAIQAKKRKLTTRELISVEEIRKLKGISVKDMKKYVGNEAGDYQKVLITTHFFAKQAIEEAANEVELIDKIGLMRLIGQICPQLLTKGYVKKLMGDLGFCEECGAPMTVGYKHGCYRMCYSRRIHSGCEAKAIPYEKE